MEENKCSCGQNLTANDIVPENDYTFWGWILVTFGITATPKKVVYHCASCGKVVKNGREIMIKT